MLNYSIVAIIEILMFDSLLRGVDNMYFFNSLILFFSKKFFILVFI